MRFAVFIVSCVLAGCTADGIPGPGASANDMSRSGDGSFPRDFAVGPDLAISGTPHRYAINHVTLPQQKSDYALDLNGDGRPDNQYGNIIGTLATQSFDLQSMIDIAVAVGN